MKANKKRMYCRPTLCILGVESSSMLASSTSIDFGGSSDELIDSYPDGSIWGE